MRDTSSVNLTLKFVKWHGARRENHVTFRHVYKLYSCMLNRRIPYGLATCSIILKWRPIPRRLLFESIDNVLRIQAMPYNIQHRLQYSFWTWFKNLRFCHITVCVCNWNFCFTDCFWEEGWTCDTSMFFGLKTCCRNVLHSVPGTSN
jgi:hypothetical protein